jgi:hypothetical protein
MKSKEVVNGLCGLLNLIACILSITIAVKCYLGFKEMKEIVSENCGYEEALKRADEVKVGK